MMYTLLDSVWGQQDSHGALHTQAAAETDRVPVGAVCIGPASCSLSLCPSTHGLQQPSEAKVQQFSKTLAVGTRPGPNNTLSLTPGHCGCCLCPLLVVCVAPLVCLSATAVLPCPATSPPLPRTCTSSVPRLRLGTPPLLPSHGGSAARAAAAAAGGT